MIVALLLRHSLSRDRNKDQRTMIRRPMGWRKKGQTQFSARFNLNIADTAYRSIDDDERIIIILKVLLVFEERQLTVD